MEYKDILYGTFCAGKFEKESNFKQRKKKGEKARKPRWRKERTNLVLVSQKPMLLYLEFNKPSKQTVSEINLFKKFNFSQCQNKCWHTD